MTALERATLRGSRKKSHAFILKGVKAVARVVVPQQDDRGFAVVYVHCPVSDCASMVVFTMFRIPVLLEVPFSLYSLITD